APSLLRPPSVTIQRQSLGKLGEDLAATALERLGYAILARRYRTRHGEIDLIAQDDAVTVFVEVKVRLSGSRGSAAEAVTRAKQRRLVSMAEDYLSRHALVDVPCRFDVVAIDGEPDDVNVVVYRNAFDAA